VSDAFADADLSIAVDDAAPNVIRLLWRGRCSARLPYAALLSFLSDWADRALASDARLELHFEELEHINSSGIAVLMQFLNQQRPTPVELTLCFRANLPWQQISFEALRVFEERSGRLRIEPV
jgi:hypothetical protein